MRTYLPVSQATPDVPTIWMEENMYYRSLYPRDLFAELDRLQREVQQAFDVSPSIRGLGRGGFPAMNVGGTPRSVEIYAFAPGIDPAAIEVQIEQGVLTIAGERKPDLPGKDAKATVHIDERFTGRFRRVVSLPDDVDPNAVQAHYRDGVLHISIERRQAAQPRRITVE
jgi:HSP20 family protein